MISPFAPDPLDLHVYRISIWRPLVPCCIFGLGMLAFSAVAIFVLPALGIPAACLFGALVYYFIRDYWKSSLRISPDGVIYRESGSEIKKTWPEISDMRVDRGHEAFITIDRRFVPLGLYSSHLRRGNLRGIILRFAPHLKGALDKMDAPLTDAERRNKAAVVGLVLGILGFLLLSAFVPNRYANWLIAYPFLLIFGCVFWSMGSIMLKKRQKGSPLADAQRKKVLRELGIVVAGIAVLAIVAALIVCYRERSTLIAFGILGPIVVLGLVVRACRYFKSKKWLFGVLFSLAALVAAPLAPLATGNLIDAISNPSTITKASNPPAKKGQVKDSGEAGDGAALQKQVTALIDQGDALRAQGQFADALKAYRESLALAERTSKRQPNDTSWQLELSMINNRVGDVLRDQGELADALKAYHESVAISKRVLKQSPGDVGWQSELACSYERVGGISQQGKQWSDAAASFELALEIARPWMARSNLDASWIGIFSYCAVGRWEVLLDAPKGAVKIDRHEALAELYTVRDAMEKAKKIGGDGPSSDESLAYVEKLLNTEASRKPGKD